MAPAFAQDITFDALRPGSRSGRSRFRSGLVTPARAPIFAPMCGRFTHRYTWADIHRLYRLTSPASSVQPSYNVCPTDTVNVVTSSQDIRIVPRKETFS